MAAIFQHVFGDKLLNKNVELEHRSSNQLPSPDELKRKIILKWRRKPLDKGKSYLRRHGVYELTS